MKHLFVVQHGMFGNSYFFNNFKKKLENAFHGSIVMLPDKNNFLYSTFGTQICGNKLLESIEETLQKHPDCISISFIGHSFGGIISRYTIGKLYEKKFFETIKPLAYISISTPHAKVIGHHSLANFILNNCAGLTGKELFGSTPMLEHLSDVNSSYFKGLELFPIKILYGNLFNDDVKCESACLYYNDTTIKEENLVELITNRLYLVNYQKLEIYNEKEYDPLVHLKNLDWKRKVVNLSEYINSHITIVGRHTFVPFLKIKSEEASIVLLDIIHEISHHLNSNKNID